MSTLQRKLAGAAVHRNQQRQDEEERARFRATYPWPASAWQRATDAIINGTWKPRPPVRYPVVLSPDGPVPSAAALQALAGMDCLPEVTVADQIDMYDRVVGQLTIADVGFDEWARLEDLASPAPAPGGEPVRVLFHGKPRLATVIRGLREEGAPRAGADWPTTTPGDEDEDFDVGIGPLDDSDEAWGEDGDETWTGDEDGASKQEGGETCRRDEDQAGKADGDEAGTGDGDRAGVGDGDDAVEGEGDRPETAARGEPRDVDTDSAAVGEGDPAGVVDRQGEAG